MERRRFWDRALHWVFRGAILVKGVDGLLELVSGALFLFIPAPALINFIFRITRSELIEDPDDLTAHWLRHHFAHLSTANKVFVGAYLLGHGLVKVALVVSLWRRKRWVYPLALVAVLGFIGFQLFKLTQHFSVLLAVLIGVDAAVLALIWREYRSLER